MRERYLSCPAVSQSCSLQVVEWCVTFLPRKSMPMVGCIVLGLRCPCPRICCWRSVRWCWSCRCCYRRGGWLWRSFCRWWKKWSTYIQKNGLLSLTKWLISWQNSKSHSSLLGGAFGLRKAHLGDLCFVGLSFDHVLVVFLLEGPHLLVLHCLRCEIFLLQFLGQLVVHILLFVV